MPTVTGVARPLGSTVNADGSVYGPWKRSNGDLYAVGESTATADRLAVARSTDGGDNWSVQGTGPDITNDLLGIGSYLAGDTLHIITASDTYTTAMGVVVYDLKYHTFNTSTNAWVITNETAHNEIKALVNQNTAPSITVRSDGDVI